jgi:hypothetical protein
MKILAWTCCALALGAACSDDDDDDGTTDDGGDDLPEVTARDFTLRVENVAPFTVLRVSSQRTKTTGTDGSLGPGELYDVRFTAGVGQSVSFAMMMFESNDWFFAPDPAGIPLYVDGQPNVGDVTSFVRLWDAGSEFDQEPGVGDATGVLQISRDQGAPDPDNRVRLVPDSMVLDTGTFVRPPIESMIRVTLIAGADRQFTLRIQNRSTANTLQTSRGPRAVTLSPVVWAVHREPGVLFVPDAPRPDNGLEQLAEAGQPDTMSFELSFLRGSATPLSRGVFVIHREDAPLFTPGMIDRALGMQPLAEDGDPTALLASIQAAGFVATGVLETGHGPAFPRESFEVEFTAEPGDKLSFATMFGTSNDWFFAPEPAGVELFLGTIPRWGDVTEAVQLWDLGTETDEELDVGINTGSQQTAPNSGREDRTIEVREVTAQRYDVLEVMHLRVTLTPH